MVLHVGLGECIIEVHGSVQIVFGIKPKLNQSYQFLLLTDRFWDQAKIEPIQSVLIFIELKPHAVHHRMILLVKEQRLSEKNVNWPNKSCLNKLFIELT